MAIIEANIFFPRKVDFKVGNNRVMQKFQCLNAGFASEAFLPNEKLGERESFKL